MQVGFLLFALVFIVFAAFVFGSIGLRATFNENNLLRQSQKVNKNNPYSRYQDETRAWQHHL